jgi:hypothetical protein
MPEPIIKDHATEALKTAASWPGADRVTLVTLATVLAATGADAEGARFFTDLAASQPGQPLPLAPTGFFQVREGHGTAPAAGPVPVPHLRRDGRRRDRAAGLEG